MLCPVCKTTNLAMTDRQGIEIDYCPQCRGVWLDRGELDRLIERAERPVAATPPLAAYSPPSRGQGQDDRYDDHHRRKRRKSLLGELFDF